MARASSGLATSSDSLFPSVFEALGAGIVRTLANADADVDHRNAKGRIPLHQAAADHAKDTVQLLIAADAQPSVLDRDGDAVLVDGKRSRLVFATLAFGATGGAFAWTHAAALAYRGTRWCSRWSESWP